MREMREYKREQMNLLEVCCRECDEELLVETVAGGIKYILNKHCKAASIRHCNAMHCRLLVENDSFNQCFSGWDSDADKRELFLRLVLQQKCKSVPRKQPRQQCSKVAK